MILAVNEIIFALNAADRIISMANGVIIEERKEERG